MNNAANASGVISQRGNRPFIIFEVAHRVRKLIHNLRNGVTRTACLKS